MSEPTWTKSRINELDTLKRLLIEASALDRANNATDRMRRIIKMATRLLESTNRMRRRSFINFLENMAFAEMMAAAESES